AFTASADVPSINIQQFWNTLTIDTKSGITPKDSAHSFMAPRAGDLVTDFVNNLGYPKELQFVSKMYMNNDYSLGNLKFGSRGGVDEGGKKKKALPAGKSKQHAPAKQPKPMKEKASKPTPSKKIHKGKVMKVHKGKKSDDHDNKDDEVQHAPKPQMEDDEYNLQRGIKISIESLQAHGQALVSGVAIYEPALVITRKLLDVAGKKKGIATDEQAAQSLLDLQ
nr:hypothetical protein [Tanacetum cinerariifolium]